MPVRKLSVTGKVYSGDMACFPPDQASLKHRTGELSMKRTLAAVALVAGLAGGLAGCGGSNTAAPTTTTTSRTSGYPSQLKDSFVDGCAEDGTVTEAQCRCVINELEKRVSLDELLRLANNPNITSDSRIREALLTCAAK